MDDCDVETPWLTWQPAQVPVLNHQVELASSLVELKRSGQKVYAFSWPSIQHSVFWALWRARRQAVLQQTDRRIACVRNAIATICQAGPQLPSLGTRLFAFAQRESSEVQRRSNGNLKSTDQRGRAAATGREG
jgi:hypothetical protein